MDQIVYITAVSMAWLATLHFAVAAHGLDAVTLQALLRYARRVNATRATQIEQRGQAVRLACCGATAAGLGLAAALTIYRWRAWIPSGNDVARSELTRDVLPLGLVVALALLAGFILPLAIARWGRPEFFHRMWPLWYWPAGLLLPVVRFWERAAGTHPSDSDTHSRVEQVEQFTESVHQLIAVGVHHGWLAASAGQMIDRILALADRDVADVMTPRDRIRAVPASVSWDELMREAARCGRARIPVYDGSLDRIIGILYLKDLLPQWLELPAKRKPWQELLRPPYFVPRRTRLDPLLAELLASRRHLALVVDEYGAVEGLITTEDILEEIVGEIFDETEKPDPTPAIVCTGPNSCEVDGTVLVSELNRQLDLGIDEDDDYDTIAGYLISQLGRIPAAGEKFQINEQQFTVLEADTRRVRRVRIEW
ncbi:MAG: hypothetical protein KatS3mg110_3653 [Pirellulaceae bacterium]|nr:MAG: hypothetical protein KatS3mg110_3653 [Pirellulaceae bacterium]